MERLLLRDLRPPKVKALPVSGVEPFAPEAVVNSKRPVQEKRNPSNFRLRTGSSSILS